MKFKDAIITAKGTPIRRYARTGVGKLVGSYLYLHKNYAREAIAKIKAHDYVVGSRLERTLAAMTPNFKFRCLRFDLMLGELRFDESPNFNTAREPMVGRWLSIDFNGMTNHGWSGAIWHHKWLWIKDDHPGFDVAQSRAWSATYAPLLKEPPSGSAFKWAAQLKAIGLA